MKSNPPANNKMTITLIIGPMYSGKTTEMIRRITQLFDLKTEGKVLIINSAVDSREETQMGVSTHCSSKSYNPHFKTIKTQKLSDVDVSSFDIIGVDECQFFPDLVEWVEAFSDSKHLICSGLNGSYQRKKIGHTTDIIPMCDEVIFLKAVCCKCNEEIVGGKAVIHSASFTKRLDESDELILVNGKYFPVCRFHY